MIRIVLGLGCALVLAGCASNKAEPPLMSEADPAVQVLNGAALRVARAAEQAALSHSVAKKTTRVTEEYQIDLDRMPQELRDPLLLEGGFNGELEVFLRSLTDAIGWPAPVFLGMRPTTPKIVSFTEQRRPVVYWFADAGYQSSDLADVRLNPSLRQVVVTYKEAGGVR